MSKFWTSLVMNSYFSYANIASFIIIMCFSHQNLACLNFDNFSLTCVRQICRKSGNVCPKSDKSSAQSQTSLPKVRRNLPWDRDVSGAEVRYILGSKGLRCRIFAQGRCQWVVLHIPYSGRQRNFHSKALRTKNGHLAGRGVIRHVVPKHNIFDSQTTEHTGLASGPTPSRMNIVPTAKEARRGGKN